jgi:nicotinamide-nucleotide amidase
MRNAEIIAIGSEMLGAEKVDTNSLYLTAQLNNLGVEVIRKCVVGDQREILTETIQMAASRSDLVILTGGLGPTEDDLTRDAAADALGRPLVFRQELCDAIEHRYRTVLKRPMPEINRRQAFLVEGAEALPNPRGSAPGQWIVFAPGKIMLLLPGPPSELKPMFANECLPRLEKLLPKQVIRTRFWRVAGMPESELDQLIAPIYTRYQNPVTTILAAVSDIQIHLRARCETEEEAERLLDEVTSQIEPLLGDRLYSKNGDPLEAVIGQFLKTRGQTLAVAESCTGGMVASRITGIPGSSAYFVGGFLTYTDAMKTSLLGVPEDLLAAHTAVSEPVALAMAQGARERTGATYALAVTGIAGPDGGTETTPVGTVFVACAGPEDNQVRRLNLFGDRARIRAFAAQAALDFFRRRLHN